MDAAKQCAEAITQAFDAFQTQFAAITQRATQRWAARDWRGLQQDAAARLELYAQVLDPLVAQVGDHLGQQVHDAQVWRATKQAYVQLIAGRLDHEIAETFFNSVTRRVFATVGVDTTIEFVQGNTSFQSSIMHVCRLYPAHQIDAGLVTTVLRDAELGLDDMALARDAPLVVERINAVLHQRYTQEEIDSVEIVRQVFYRNKGAYLVGRISCAGQFLPLVIALVHDADGVRVDAVLLDEADISIVFSFTRSSFHVIVEQPRALVGFLRSLLPRKPIAELYASLGYPKHAKTERYRALQAHLRRSTDQFRIAPGERGMVMLVFDLPSYDLVFKIIKDRFAEPKTTTRQDVLQRYQLVFRHDRGGRLVDAQEFEHVQFERARFSTEVLDELRQHAASSVQIDDQYVIIKHLYTERRLTPLNLFLQTASHDVARAVIVDYGQALKDLAATNIYPGDILLKNFGVTQRGRVVFYDYDELCLVTDLNVRAVPPPRNDDDEWDAEPWFFVGEHDMFPQEFRTFLGLQGPLRELFTEAHGELFTVPFWTTLQQQHRAGEVLDLFPYGQEARL